jgi:two-component system LytT family sensor kinase
MSTTSLADLVDFVGILTALTLYAMLLSMALRERMTQPAGRPKASGTTLALTTALLGLAWNLGALTFLGSSHPRPATFAWRAATVAAYVALGFLPALFVSAALRPWSRLRRGAGVWVGVVGYGMASIAAVLHVLNALLAGSPPSATGLRLLALGSLGIVPAVLWTAPRSQRVHRGLVAAAAVLVFALCALHLAQHLPGHDTWSSALLGHHASLPLALAILYLDYRFAFVDIFLKRALALTLLAGIVLGLYVGVAGPILSTGDGHLGREPRAVGILLGLWAATALGFPLVQRLTNRFVDSVLLRRPDYARLRGEIAEIVAGQDSTDEILNGVCARLARALHARGITWSAADPQGPPAAPSLPPARRTVVLPTHEPPRFALEIRELAPGKVLLSDDLALLDAVALLVARRIDSLRLTHERCERDYREQEVARLATEAELRALRAQLNPHFLFNALNTIGYLMRAAPERAFGTLLDLTRLLRAVLKRSGGDFATLGQELELVRAYLAIEGARFEDRLRVVVDVPEPLQASLVPPLVLQPLVENAIKHGITLRAEGGEVSIVARRHETDETLVLQVVDTGMGASESRMTEGRREGLGLASIERRLAAYYGRRGSLEITSQPGLGTRATLRIPCGPVSGQLGGTLNDSNDARPLERTGASA